MDGFVFDCMNVDVAVVFCLLHVCCSGCAFVLLFACCLGCIGFYCMDVVCAV